MPYHHCYGAAACLKVSCSLTGTADDYVSERMCVRESDGLLKDILFFLTVNLTPKQLQDVTLPKYLPESIPVILSSLML